MFRARMVAGSDDPAVRNPTGPGRPFTVEGMTIKGTFALYDGVPTEVEYRDSEGKRQTATIGGPPEALLRRDDCIIELIDSRPWPESATHRHLRNQARANEIRLEVMEGRYFTEWEIEAQRRAEALQDPEVRVAYLMETHGVEEKEARALVGVGRSKPSKAEEILALKDKHLKKKPSRRGRKKKAQDEEEAA